MPAPDARNEMVNYLRQQLLGPHSGKNETLFESPARRYLLWMLFPQANPSSRIFGEEVIEDNPLEIGDESTDGSIALSTQHMPSSMGVSFVVEQGSNLKIFSSAARYERESHEKWNRIPLGNLNSELDFVSAFPVSDGSINKFRVLDDRADVNVKWRDYGNDHLVTVALVNNSVSDGENQNDEDILCQAELRCELESGKFLPYPRQNLIGFDDEEKEQELLYRNVPVYAIGHGCAADWDESNDVKWVKTEFLPTTDIPGVTFDIKGDDSVLDLSFLSKIDKEHNVIVKALRSFVSSYEIWIEETLNAAEVAPELQSAKDRLAQRLSNAAFRMNEGVEMLDGVSREAIRARKAFSIANEAMLMQMRHSKPDLGGKRRKRADAIDPKIDYSTFEKAAWRPFQLAFILLAIPSLIDEDHPDRDVVDLIWFPTGGGKTEAYLGLVAFQIAIRRIHHGDKGGGTTVITRYTLRLLTTQQFQRAATLICALELIRRTRDEELGSEPITIGIWVGGETTPNTIADAEKIIERLKDGEEPSVGFSIELCPWCGTELIPEGTFQPEDWGFRTSSSFIIFCPNNKCEFSSELPICVVDEVIYSKPPTFLIATIDKFAQMTWNSYAGSLLGVGRDMGPSLVIQDELHLISGPLGTIASLYEVAFDIIMGKFSKRPKVVSSTATIRMAESQVRSLFDREVFLFPPSGMDAADSYFVHQDKSVPGRRYLGVMSQSHTPTTSEVHTLSSLLQAPIDLKLAPEAKDTYWTVVAYHNSLRELGKTVTIARDDVPARLRVVTADGTEIREMEGELDIVELTSNVPSLQIPKNLERLGRTINDDDPVSIAACTNMFSVGVDIQRLGLMLVVGQPKTTSEYIQATSRIGRDPKRSPGLIVMHYSSAKPRDRSHYENFKAYHQSIYREVESTSVTPWALPARERALHAILVILVRFVLGLRQNSDAGDFESTSELSELVHEIIERTKKADESEFLSTKDHLERLIEEWIEFVSEAQEKNMKLFYKDQGKATLGILRDFNSKGNFGWATLHSMRNVDQEIQLRVDGERP